MQHHTTASLTAHNSPAIRLLAVAGVCAVALVIVCWTALFVGLLLGLRAPDALLGGFSLICAALLVIALETGVAVEHVRESARALWPAAGYQAPAAPAARVAVDFVVVPGLRPPVSLA